MNLEALFVEHCEFSEAHKDQILRSMAGRRPQISFEAGCPVTPASENLCPGGKAYVPEAFIAQAEPGHQQPGLEQK